MIRGVALPKIPGYSFDANIGRTNFRRCQLFETLNNVQMITESDKPGASVSRGEDDGSRYPSLYPRGEVMEVPAWIIYDKKVLCFDAYFKETAQERDGYAYHVRKCKIYYYLEDGTMQVTEPKTRNSGIPQGTLIKRHRVPYPSPYNDEFYGVLDLNVGRDLDLYGRVFRVTSCDRFTRVFLNRLGISVPDPVEMPEDPYSRLLAEGADTRAARKPNRSVDTRGQFLTHDRHVLRFFGYWDDRATEGGFLHDLEVHYYLADDTMEVKDKIPPNSGRDRGFMLCRRARMPKVFDALPGIGQASKQTVLNVMCGVGTGARSRYLVDALNVGADSTEFYGEADLAIGATINAYGRHVTLTDCDDYTKDYYRSKYGIADFTPAPRPPVPEVKVLPSVFERELPPYNGYGSYEDTAMNCRTMVPTRPKGRDREAMAKSRQGYDSYVLRFRAKLVTKNRDNDPREFIVLYYPEDDTFAVNELLVHNIGFVPGRFCRRFPMYRAGAGACAGPARLPTGEPERYRGCDVYVGNTLHLNDFAFVLVDADEYAFRYMEVNCGQFPKSNILAIMEKLRTALRPIYKDFVVRSLGVKDVCECKVLPYCTLRNAIKQVLKDDITEHEVIVVARHYNARCRDRERDCELVRSIVHAELRRSLWEQGERLGESLRHVDAGRSCLLDRERLYLSLRSSRLPLDRCAIYTVLDCLPRQEGGLINYNDLLQFLDYKSCPAASVVPVCVLDEFSDVSDFPAPTVGLVNLEAFLKDLDLEGELGGVKG